MPWGRRNAPHAFEAAVLRLPNRVAPWAPVYIGAESAIPTSVDFNRFDCSARASRCPLKLAIASVISSRSRFVQQCRGCVAGPLAVMATRTIVGVGLGTIYSGVGVWKNDRVETTASSTPRRSGMLQTILAGAVGVLVRRQCAREDGVCVHGEASLDMLYHRWCQCCVFDAVREKHALRPLASWPPALSNCEAIGRYGMFFELIPPRDAADELPQSIADEWVDRCLDGGGIHGGVNDPELAQPADVVVEFGGEFRAILHVLLESRKAKVVSDSQSGVRHALQLAEVLPACALRLATQQRHAPARRSGRLARLGHVYPYDNRTRANLDVNCMISITILPMSILPQHLLWQLPRWEVAEELGPQCRGYVRWIGASCMTCEHQTHEHHVFASHVEHRSHGLAANGCRVFAQMHEQKVHLADVFHTPTVGACERSHVMEMHGWRITGVTISGV